MHPWQLSPRQMGVGVFSNVGHDEQVHKQLHDGTLSHERMPDAVH
jgi:hypothetical protein